MKILKMFLNKKYKEKNNNKEKYPTLFSTLITQMLINTKEISLHKSQISIKNYKTLMPKKYKFSPKKPLFKSSLLPIKQNFKRMKDYSINVLKVLISLFRHENY